MRIRRSSSWSSCEAEASPRGWQKDRRPVSRLALDIAVQLCEGLHYAHEHGVVHRDVKPANIWLEEDGTLKLLDFGVAHIVDTGLTRHGESVGTLAYTAPEQLTGGLVDRRADVFSVGAVLFELLSGRRPFDGSTPAATLKRVRGDVSLPVGSLPAEVPDDVRAAILKATDSQIDRRYETAADLAVDLRLSLLSLPASALGSPLEDPDTPVGCSPRASTEAFAQTETLPPTQTVCSLPRRGRDGRRGRCADRARSSPSRNTSGPVAAGPRTRRASALASHACTTASADIAMACSRGEGAPPRASGVAARGCPGQADRAVGDAHDPRTRALAATGGLLVLAVVWVGIASRRPEASAAPKKARTAGGHDPKSAASGRPGQDAAVDVLIDSRPAGASIWFGNRDSGLRTPAHVPIAIARNSRLTLRLPGYEDAALPAVVSDSSPATRTVTLTRGAGAAIAPTRRDGIVPVRRGGRRSRRVGATHGALGDIYRGTGGASACRRVLPRLASAVGKSATTEVRAAGLGDLEVRSARETCFVTIDGRKIDYPPVKQRIAAGAHIIALADCPGAVVRKRTEVRAGLREAVILR